MNHKTILYYILLVILFGGQLFSFVLTQYIIYDIYFNQIHWNFSYQLLILPLVFYIALSFLFSLILDLIFNPKEVSTKISLAGLLFPMLLIYNSESVGSAVIFSVISMISMAYWFFFTFYWKKRNLKP